MCCISLTWIQLLYYYSPIHKIMRNGIVRSIIILLTIFNQSRQGCVTDRHQQHTCIHGMSDSDYEQDMDEVLKDVKV